MLTGDELGDVLWGRRIRDWPLLARDRVRFIGDRVAVVAAESADIARAAIQAIDVEYEELPAVFDPLEALNPDAPILHENGDGYALFGPGTRAPRSHPNVQGTQAVHKDDADIDAVFASAQHVFEHTFTTPREHQGFIEPPGSLLWIDDRRRRPRRVHQQDALRPARPAHDRRGRRRAAASTSTPTSSAATSAARARSTTSC